MRLRAVALTVGAFFLGVMISVTRPASGSGFVVNGSGGGGGTVTTSSPIQGDGSAGSPVTLAQGGATAGQVYTWNGIAWIASDGVLSLWGGTSAFVLTSNGPGTKPSYQALPSATTTLQQAYTNGGSGGGAILETASGGPLALTAPLNAFIGALTVTEANTGQTALLVTSQGSGISCPGSGASSERFGSLASTGPGVSNVAIGNNARANINSGSNAVVIGAGAQGDTNDVAIGQGANAAFTTDAIIIGRSTQALNSCVVIGTSATATATNQLVLGSSSTNITNAYIGNGVTSATPAATVSLRVTGGTGAGVAGSALRLASGQSGDAATAGSSVILGVSLAGTGTATTDILTLANTGNLSLANAGGLVFAPATDNTWSLGTASNRFALVRAVTVTSGAYLEEERFPAEALASPDRIAALAADLDAQGVGSVPGVRHLARIAMVSARAVVDLDARLRALERKAPK